MKTNNIGSRGLHVLHGAFKVSTLVTNINFRKNINFIFICKNDTPAHFEDFQSLMMQAPHV